MEEEEKKKEDQEQKEEEEEKQKEQKQKKEKRNEETEKKEKRKEEKEKEKEEEEEEKKKEENKEKKEEGEEKNDMEPSGDIFVHQSAIEGSGWRCLTQGQRVTFTCRSVFRLVKTISKIPIISSISSLKIIFLYQRCTIQ
jgi:hypothetical protein